MLNMDIEKFAYDIIEKLKALPPEAKQTGPDGDLKTVWDKFKEQVHYVKSSDSEHPCPL